MPGNLVDAGIRPGRRIALGRGRPDPMDPVPAGVSTGADGTSASFVGAVIWAEPDLPGRSPVYGYSHVLGLTTVVPNDALESVSFAKGGFGGNQGNFSASHIAISTKQPAEDRHHTTLFLNNFLTGGHVSGPISDKMSYALSGRISPLGLEYSALKGLMDGHLGSLDHFKAGVGDLYGKFHWKAGDGKRLTAFVLASLDRYGFNMPDGSDEKMGWSNLVASVRYHKTGKKGTSDLSASYNSYGSSQELSNMFHGTENHFSLRSRLDEITLSEDFAKDSDGAARWKMGGRLRYAAFRPGEWPGPSTGNGS